jgi:hypothetical protein
MLEDRRHVDHALERGAHLHDEATRLVERFLRGDAMELSDELNVKRAYFRAFEAAGLRDITAHQAVHEFTRAVRSSPQWLRDNPARAAGCRDALNEYEDEAIEILAEILQ